MAPTPVYRAALIRDPECVAAIDGLGETGDGTDLPVLRQTLRSTLPRVRQPAVRGLARIGKADVAGELMDALGDASPAVVREACRRLELLADGLAGESLLAIATTALSSQGRRCAVRLIVAKGKWPSLPWLIRVSTCTHAETRRLAQTAVERWFTAALAECGTRIDERVLAKLRRIDVD